MWRKWGALHRGKPGMAGSVERVTPHPALRATFPSRGRHGYDGVWVGSAKVDGGV